MYSQALIRKSSAVERLLHSTKAGRIAWQPSGFERKCDNWEIAFVAKFEGKVITVARKHSIEYGGWISRTVTTLTVASGSDVVLNESYSTDRDYVETLDLSGVLAVSDLASHVLDLFRAELNLHWSVM